jgi:hypothetical protein
MVVVMVAASLSAVAFNALIAVPQAAKPPARAPERFDEIVREDFFAGLRGDQVAFARAMKVCQERLAGHPKDAAAMVWQGAGLYYLAGRAFAAGDYAKGMELNTQGLSEMDEAVNLDPTVRTLIPRGAMLMAASKHLSDPAQRTATLKKGVGDFERVLELNKDSFDKLCVHDRGELLGGLAEGWYRLGDQAKADAYLKRMVAELPNTGYSRRAAAVTKEHPSPELVSLTCMGCHTSAP